MARKGNSVSKTIVWVLMGLLFVGLAGFGAVNFSGSVRQVGQVGDKPISTDAYVRALQQELRALQAQTGQPISLAQARAFGLDRQVLGQLVTTRALDWEASQLGLSIGDENLRRQLVGIQAFQGIDGTFDREAYRFAIQNSGMSEAEFEAQLREEAARTILQAAVLSGTPMPDAYGDALIDYIGARRSFSWVRVTGEEIEAEIPAPSETQIQAYYDDNIADFTAPEIRRITYAWLTPEMMLDTVEVPEDAIQDAYDARAEQYNQPERRLVERLTFGDEARANDAAAQLEVGGTTFETLVEDRGLALADVDMGDMSRAELGAAGEAVFEAQVGDVVGPFQSDLGPAFFRVNGVLPAQEIALEDVRDELRDEIARDRARRLIETRGEDIADLLAGGATLEDLVTETDMQLGQIDWFDGAQGDIAGYVEFQEVAATVTMEDFPDVAELSDGGLFALRLDEVVDPAPRPLDEVRADVIAAWTEDALAEAVVARAEEIAAALGEGRTFEALELEPTAESGLIRSDFVAGTRAGFMEQVFAMEVGAVDVIADGDSAIVVQLEAELPPDPGNTDLTEARAQLVERAAQGVAQDLYQAYSADIQRRAGISLDQAALNAVNSSLQ
ncbi:SurA N-terminal domain-containing protein [Mesobacterium pallidum]|uniref:SurA N-terminal domain-containing protein n=1 Tax=Mesobacterium pallidum TaxID=2872037 RepID=UPI001EE3870C|nr:SurA N-terminal domain-containing protein [Mesobacterium pallidum]